MPFGTPANVTAAIISDLEILVSWSAVEQAISYDIERDGVLIVENFTGLSYIDSEVTHDINHSYRVRARAPGITSATPGLPLVLETSSVSPVEGKKTSSLIQVVENELVQVVTAIIGPVSGLNAPAPPSSGSALQSFIDSVPNGATVNFTPGGQYVIADRELRFVGKSGVTFNGNGCRITSTYDGVTRNVMKIITCSDTIFQDFETVGFTGPAPLDGNGDPQAVKEAHGFMLRDCDRVTMLRCVGLSLRDDGFWVGHFGQAGPDRGQCHDITIQDCEAYVCRRHCLSPVHVGGLVVRGCTFDKVGTTSGTLIDMEPLTDGDFVADVLIEDNDFGWYPTSAERRSIQANGAPQAYVADVTIRGNRSQGKEFGVVINNNGDGGYLSGFRDFVIEDNISDPNAGCPVAPFRAHRMDRITVRNNRASLNPGVGFTQLVSVTGQVISGNVDTS